MKGVNPTFNTPDFVASDGRPGYYTPFDDSVSGWGYARMFSNWVHRNHDSSLPILVGFYTANTYARNHPERFKAWYTLMKLRGE